MKNRLLQLLSDNRRAFTPIEARIVAADDSATIYLYDPIVSDRITAEWWGGVCPQDFVPAVRAIKAKEIHLRINCPGGDVFGAEAMCQALRESSAKVIAHIEGYAASAATAIACACDEVVMTPASKYMIHQSWTLAIGNSNDMRATAALLDICDESLFEAYATKTGKGIDQIKEWCAAETWFTAEQAVANGFADRLTTEAGAKASAKFNLKAYLNAPEPEAEPAPTLSTEEHRERQQQRLRMLSTLQVA